MKKLFLVLWVIFLAGCNVSNQFDSESQVYNNDQIIDVSFVDVNKTTYDDVVEVLGLGDQYYDNGVSIDSTALPNSFIMYYDEGLGFVIHSGYIREMRIESENINFNDNELYVGQPIEEALALLTPPNEVEENIHLYYMPGIYYKNVKGRFVENVSYYLDRDNAVRVWGYEDKLSSIYFMSDKYNEDVNITLMGKSDRDSYELGHGLFDSDTYKFVDDERIIGNWEFKDWVYALEDLDFNKRRSNLLFTDLRISEKGNIEKCEYMWSSGIFIDTMFPFDSHPYRITIKDGKEILIVEMYDGLFVFEKQEEEISDTTDTPETVVTVNPFDDVRKLSLSGSDYDLEDIKTFWFNEKTDFGQNSDYAQEIMEKGKNPGLGVRSIHESGITGKGVKVGIIDQNMCLNHPEFAGKIVEYKDFDCNQPEDSGSMHGPAVTSLLVGETIGVAPNAEVYYAAAPSWTGHAKHFADALLWMIEINRSLPVDDKIKVVSVSAAPSGQGSPFEKNNKDWDDAMKLAKEEGILVLDCTMTYGFIGPGYYDIENPDDITSFKLGWPDYKIQSSEKGNIFAPTSLRTQAEEYVDGDPSYQYTGKGGLSWGIPYVAGTLALGLEVDPTLTADEMKVYLFETAYELDDGNLVINPVSFVEKIINQK